MRGTPLRRSNSGNNVSWAGGKADERELISIQTSLIWGKNIKRNVDIISGIRETRMVARLGGSPEGEKRMTLTAELWAVPLGARPLWKVAVGSLSFSPSNATVQICGPERVTKWAKMGKGKKRGERADLDVVVGTGGGGVEVKAEHRL
jgi:hypothetical protein